MKGPWLPIYGCGAVTILIAGDMSDGSVIGLFVIGALLATVLEYITGEAMVRIFKEFAVSTFPSELIREIAIGR